MMCGLSGAINGDVGTVEQIRRRIHSPVRFFNAELVKQFGYRPGD